MHRLLCAVKGAALCRSCIPSTLPALTRWMGFSCWSAPLLCRVSRQCHGRACEQCMRLHTPCRLSGPLAMMSTVSAALQPPKQAGP